MIEARGLRYRYPGAGTCWTLDGVNLYSPQGELTLIAGASGSGKSTLAYTICGLIPHLLCGELQGRLLFRGEDITGWRPRDLLPRVALAVQNIDAHLFNPTVEEELAFGLESLGLPEEEISLRIEETARSFGIGHLLGRSPWELSGGEKRLVGIAALACMPSPALVLDEPMAHLDEARAAKVMNFLQVLKAQGRSILVVEHRVQKLLEISDRCLIMEEGRICFEGSGATAAGELAARGLIPKYRPKPFRDPGSRPVLLEVKDLCSRASGRWVLRGISFSLHQGEVVAIVGPNGAGKTTLVRHLNGLARPVGGQILLGGKPIGGRDPSQLASEMGLVFQNPDDQFFRTSVREEILSGPIAAERCSPERLNELAVDLNIHQLLDRSPYRLSEGEKRRVAVASALAMDPKLLVLDEPTAGQDARARMELARIIDQQRQKGCSMLIVTHDMAFAQAVADRFLVLDEGRIVSKGQTDGGTGAISVQAGS